MPRWRWLFSFNWYYTYHAVSHETFLHTDPRTAWRWPSMPTGNVIGIGGQRMRKRRLRILMARALRGMGYLTSLQSGCQPFACYPPDYTGNGSAYFSELTLNILNRCYHSPREPHFMYKTSNQHATEGWSDRSEARGNTLWLPLVTVYDPIQCARNLHEQVDQITISVNA